MIEGHIFIQGIISPWQDDDAGKWGEVNIKDITQQIQDNKDADKLIVHIHSPGGDVDEGFGIHDILVASGKVIETRIEGLCASIATVISLAGSIRLITQNSDFMIHTPFTWAEGDADDFQKYADQLQVIEDKIIDFYVAKTGSSRESIEEMMKEETWLSADQAKELGFVTEIITTMKKREMLRAVAKVRFNKSDNNITMNKEQFEQSMEKGHNSILDKLKKLLNLSGVKALTVTTADSTVLDFGDQVETVEEIATGMTATLEGGGTPEGDFPMPDGRTFVFDSSGTLSEIKEAEGDDDVEALKQKITDLEAELATANAQATKTETAVKAIQAELVKFKSEVTSNIETFGKEGFNKDNGEGKENRFGNLKIAQ